MKGCAFMAVANKTVISFGLVAIPIAMYTAVQNHDISFNHLHKEDDSRIRYKKVCSHCEKELKAEDIIKGYQYDKDSYVTVSNEEIEKIKTEKDKTIQILHFANLNEISPVYYEKSYQALPEKGGDKAFELLRRSLMDEQKIAIGKTVMGSRETLMAIIPREDGIIIQTMNYEDEIKEIPKTYDAKEVNKQELELAKNLINSMDTPFNPAEYKDEYQEKLKSLIEDKIAGKEIKTPRAEKSSKIIDIKDALEQSLKKAKAGKKPTPKKTSKKKAAS